MERRLAAIMATAVVGYSDLKLATGITMGKLEIRLFVRFNAEFEGRPINIAGTKYQVLLAYLAYNAGMAVHCEDLVGLP